MVIAVVVKQPEGIHYKQRVCHFFFFFFKNMYKDVIRESSNTYSKKHNILYFINKHIPRHNGFWCFLNRLAFFFYYPCTDFDWYNGFLCSVNKLALFSFFLNPCTDFDSRGRVLYMHILFKHQLRIMSFYEIILFVLELETFFKLLWILFLDHFIKIEISPSSLAQNKLELLKNRIRKT